MKYMGKISRKTNISYPLDVYTWCVTGGKKCWFFGNAYVHIKRMIPKQLSVFSEISRAFEVVVPNYLNRRDS